MTDHKRPGSGGAAGPETSSAAAPAPPFGEKIGRAHLDPDAADPRDPLLVPFSKFADRANGLSVVDAWRRRPAKTFRRGWVSCRGGRESSREYSTTPNVLLVAGAAVGLGEDGLVRHIRPYHRLQGFAGFVMDHTDNNGAVRVVVKAAGITTLRIAGLQLGGEGKKVYVSDVNSFSLEASAGYLMGHVLHVQPDAPGWAQVAFSAFNVEASMSEAREISRRRR
jgi:hypothetical protein